MWSQVRAHRADFEKYTQKLEDKIGIFSKNAGWFLKIFVFKLWPTGFV